MNSLLSAGMYWVAWLSRFCPLDSLVGIGTKEKGVDGQQIHMGLCTVVILGALAFNAYILYGAIWPFEVPPSIKLGNIIFNS